MFSRTPVEEFETVCMKSWTPVHQVNDITTSKQLRPYLAKAKLALSELDFRQVESWSFSEMYDILPRIKRSQSLIKLIRNWLRERLVAALDECSDQYHFEIDRYSAHFDGHLKLIADCLAVLCKGPGKKCKPLNQLKSALGLLRAWKEAGVKRKVQWRASVERWRVARANRALAV